MQATRQEITKRFVKGLLACLVGAGLTYLSSFITKNPTILGSMTLLLPPILLALEKAFVSY